MTDLWTEASRDVEAEQAERRLTAARIAAAPVWAFVAKSMTDAEYQHRKALVAARLEDAVIEAVGSADPELLRELEAALDEDMDVVIAEAMMRVEASEEICTICGKAITEMDMGLRLSGDSQAWIHVGDDKSYQGHVPRPNEYAKAAARRRFAAKIAAEGGSTCATCGSSIEKDPAGENPSTWHHNNGSSHDHEAKPGTTASKVAYSAPDGTKATCGTCGQPIESMEYQWYHLTSEDKAAQQGHDPHPNPHKGITSKQAAGMAITCKSCGNNFTSNSNGVGKCPKCKSSDLKRKYAAGEGTHPSATPEGGDHIGPKEDCPICDSADTDNTSTKQNKGDFYAQGSKLPAPGSRHPFAKSAAENPNGAWKVQVTGIREMTWSENALRFDSQEEAQAYAYDLLGRWTGADMARVVPSDTPNKAPVDTSDPAIVINYRTAARKVAVSLTNVGVEGDNGVGTDSSGNRVKFKLTPKELSDLKSVLFSDLAINFSGVTVDEGDIIKDASKVAAGATTEPLPLRCGECDKRFKKKIGPKTFEVKCPGCGSYDTEPDYEAPGGRAWASLKTAAGQPFPNTKGEEPDDSHFPAKDGEEEAKPAEGDQADPSTMEPGAKVTVHFQTVTGEKGDCDGTFATNENGAFTFQYENGTFGVTQGAGGWVDSAGNTFTFSLADAAPATSPEGEKTQGNEKPFPQAQASRRPFGSRTALKVIITHPDGRELAYDRTPQSTSLMDRMLAEDSAIKAFIADFGVEPAKVRTASRKTAKTCAHVYCGSEAVEGGHGLCAEHKKVEEQEVGWSTDPKAKTAGNPYSESNPYSMDSSEDPAAVPVAPEAPSTPPMAQPTNRAPVTTRPRTKPNGQNNDLSVDPKPQPQPQPQVVKATWDAPMGTINPEKPKALNEHMRCSNCLIEFDHEVHDPSDPIPPCPSCGSDATAVYPKIPSIGSKQAMDEDFPNSGGFLAYIRQLWTELRAGGGDIPSWFPERLLTEQEIQTRKWIKGQGGDFSHAFGSRQADALADKISLVTEGVLESNPGMDDKQAMLIAFETVCRFPEMVRG